MQWINALVIAICFCEYILWLILTSLLNRESRRSIIKILLGTANTEMSLFHQTVTGISKKPKQTQAHVIIKDTGIINLKNHLSFINKRSKKAKYEKIFSWWLWRTSQIFFSWRTISYPYSPKVSPEVYPKVVLKVIPEVIPKQVPKVMEMSMLCSDWLTPHHPGPNS